MEQIIISTNSIETRVKTHKNQKKKTQMKITQNFKTYQKNKYG